FIEAQKFRRRHLSANQKLESQAPGNPLRTHEPVTVASFRTWRGWRDCVARDPAPDPFDDNKDGPRSWKLSLYNDNESCFIMSASSPTRSLSVADPIHLGIDRYFGVSLFALV